MSWEQINNAITFYAMYVASKVGKTGLTPTVDVFRAGSLIVTAASGVEVGDGLYSYTLAVGSVTVEGEYAAVFKTSDSTVDQQHIPALWIVGRAGVERLDANVGTIGDLIEHRFGTHTAQRSVYLYVAPNTGNDTTGNGSRALPYATVTKALSVITTSNRHAVIFLIADSTSGATTLTEAVTVNKPYVFVKGPGRDFIWTRAGNGATITVSSDGVSLSGFQLESPGSGATSRGVSATDVDFLLVHRVWFNATTSDGIRILRGDNCRIYDCDFQNTGTGATGDALAVDGTAGTASYNEIVESRFSLAQGDAIHLTAATFTKIERCTFQGSTEYGVNVNGAANTDTLLIDNRWGSNTLGNLSDTGTRTIDQNNDAYTEQDTWTAAKAAFVDAAISSRSTLTAQQAEDEILNALTSAHVTTGTVGAAIARIGTAEITVVAPVATDGTVTLVQGDDYDNDDGRALDFQEASASQWPTLTGATIKFTVRSLKDVKMFEAAGSVVTATGFPKKVRIELTDAQTVLLTVTKNSGTATPTTDYKYDVEATLATSSAIVTLALGRVVVQEHQTRP